MLVMNPHWFIRTLTLCIWYIIQHLLIALRFWVLFTGGNIRRRGRENTVHESTHSFPAPKILIRTCTILFPNAECFVIWAANFSYCQLTYFSNACVLKCSLKMKCLQWIKDKAWCYWALWVNGATAPGNIWRKCLNREMPARRTNTLWPGKVLNKGYNLLSSPNTP